MTPVFKVIYSPIFVAQRLDKEARRLSPGYGVTLNPDHEFVISDKDKPIYTSTSDQEIQVRLDTLRITRNFQKYRASRKENK